MPQADEAARLKLKLPPPVAEILTCWAVFELRAFVAGLMGE
jgi:hypothetical protein